MTLSDVWIDPEFIPFDEDSDKKYPRTAASFANILDIIKKGDNLLISGDEKSGKTRTCFGIFKELSEAGCVPVLLDGSKINNPSPDRLLARIKVAYRAQYSGPNIGG